MAALPQRKHIPYSLTTRPCIIRLAASRVVADEHDKIYGALHARIPMVTPDEQRAVQEENARDDERFRQRPICCA